MNAADARDGLANGDAADQQAALGWMEQHTPIGQEVVVSETPRTDAFDRAYSASASSCACDIFALARQLERELAAVHRMVAYWVNQANGFANQYMQEREKVRVLREAMQDCTCTCTPLFDDQPDGAKFGPDCTRCAALATTEASDE